MISYAEFKELVTDTILDFYPKGGVQRKLVEVKKYQNGEQMDGSSRLWRNGKHRFGKTLLK